MFCSNLLSDHLAFCVRATWIVLLGMPGILFVSIVFLYCVILCIRMVFQERLVSGITSLPPRDRFIFAFAGPKWMRPGGDGWRLGVNIWINRRKGALGWMTKGCSPLYILNGIHWMVPNVHIHTYTYVNMWKCMVFCMLPVRERNSRRIMKDLDEIKSSGEHSVLRWP